MLNKYTFSNNLAVVDLPSIWKIGNGKVSITHASGTNTVDIPNSGYLTVKVGNIFSIQEEDISPIEAVEIENPNSGNNSGNNSGSDSGGGSSSGSDSSSSNQGNVNVSISITNTLDRAAYITGHIHTAFLRPNPTAEQIANNDTWGYIYIDIVPETTGAAKYKIKAGETVVVPSSMLSITAKSPEVPSEYFGGGIFYEQDGETPAYWRLYSWTDNRDPALIKSTPGNTTTFDNGGTLYFNIVKIRDDLNDSDYQGLMNGGNEPQDAILLSEYVTQQLNNNSGSNNSSGGDSGSETTPSGDGINLRLVNDTGVEVRYNGKVVINVSNNPNSWSSYVQINANVHDYLGYNDIIIPAGTSKSVNIPSSHISYLIHNVNGEDLHDPSSYANTNFLNGDWHIMAQAKNEYHYPVFIYSTFCYGDNPSDTSSHSSLNMYIPGPPSATKLINGGLYTIHITSVNSNATLQPNNTGHYVILAENQTSLS